MISGRGLRPFTSCFPAGIGRLLALPLAALLLMQHLPLAVPAAECCDPGHCQCTEQVCACPGCTEHDSEARASDHPTLRPCGDAPDAMPLPTLTISESLTAKAQLRSASLFSSPIQVVPRPPSSPLLVDEVFHPPKKHVG